MGSGTTRAFWSGKGSRSARRSMTKTRSIKGKDARLKMKAWRAEAKRIASTAKG